ncbi:MAG TPA: nickel pincer cofactor biosynthesis protein LarC [Dissulfurispiraceae bacterium]|nr:nickel pincer cofactor biosynthesis protein LarC [Dissulfurispiraceae bacterium]
MKTAYFECAAGISGDMCLGALVDAGAKFNAIKKLLSQIPIAGYTISARRVMRAGISSTKVDVIVVDKRGHAHSETRKWKDIRAIVNKSVLPERIKQKGLAIFRNLFEAEGKVHGEPFDSVHLHELGATDCIVDIFGTLIGMDVLGIEKVVVSPINLGSGTVHTAHGILPVPTPATIELLKGFPVYSSEIQFELTTPTGAVILKTLASSSTSFPCMSVETIGYGAGNREITRMPNVLRLSVGRPYPADGATDNSVMVMETNIDDMNPQYYEGAMKKLFAAGALDVFLENIIMKKGRPAVKLTAIVGDNEADKIADILFRETTTIGIRFYRAERKVLDREIKKIKTKYGLIRFKISRLRGKIMTCTPEYEDVRSISEKTNIPAREIVRELAGCK